MKKYILCLLAFLALTACGPLKTANEAFQLNDYATTILECKTVILRDSTNAEAFELLGDAFSRQGQMDSAVTAWNSAFQLSEEKQPVAVKLADAYVVFADTQIVKKKYKNALALLDTGLEYTPENAAIIEKKGDVFRMYRRPDQAKEQYELALSMTSDSALLFTKLTQLDSLKVDAQSELEKGIQLLKQRKHLAAIKVLKQAVELKPDLKSARYHLHMAQGRYNYKRGSKKELWDAVDEFARAANYAPDKGEPYYWMGLAYHKKNKKEYENAIQQFEYAAEIEPNGEYAQAALKKARELRAHQEKMRKFWGK